MRLIADMLSLQDPDKPHTWLTRTIVSLIIVTTSLIYTGFFGVLGAIGAYLVCVELMSLDPRWALVPLGLALVIGMRNGLRNVADYWRNYGHG